MICDLIVADDWLTRNNYPRTTDPERLPSSPLCHSGITQENDMKTCTGCGETKRPDLFHANKSQADGLYSRCKECRKIASKEYYAKNRDKKRQKDREYHAKNREKRRAYAREYSSRPESKRKAKERSREYRKNNRERIRTLHKRWRDANSEHVRSYYSDYRAKNREHILSQKRKYRKERNDPNRLISNALRKRILDAIAGNAKAAPTRDLLGCSIDEFKSYMESLFTEGMSWGNRGKNGWHIDHIIPCSAFDLSDPEQQRKCFHYTNLQPLWARENLSKNNFLPNGERASNGTKTISGRSR